MGDLHNTSHVQRSALDIPQQQYEQLEQGSGAVNKHVQVEDVDEGAGDSSNDVEATSISRDSPWSTWGKQKEDDGDHAMTRANGSDVHSAYHGFEHDPEKEEDWLQPYLIRASNEMESTNDTTIWEDPHPHLDLDSLEEELWRLRQEIPVILLERTMFKEWIQQQQVSESHNEGVKQLHPMDLNSVVAIKKSAKRASSRNRKRLSDTQNHSAPEASLSLSYKQKLDIAIKKNGREERKSDALKQTNWEVENELRAAIEAAKAAETVLTRRLLTMQRMFSERNIGPSRRTSVHLYLAGQKDLNVVPLEYFLKLQGEEEKSTIGTRNKYATLVESSTNKLQELRGRASRNSGDDQFRITKLDYEQMKVQSVQLEKQLQGVLSEIMSWKRRVTKAGKTYNATVSALGQEEKLKETMLTDIEQRNAMLQKIRTERKSVDADVSKARARNQKLKWNIEKFRNPSVIDYIQEKADLHASEQHRAALEHRVGLAEAEASSAKSWWKYIQEHELAPLVAPPRSTRM
eukprot:m.255256 g.255256  ORF g.255256 m.255256 type:complete len:518 (-) comp19613_c0_seq1:290-1843(-)